MSTRKLSDEQIVAIRTAYARGWKNRKQLSDLYGVSPTTISFIAEGSIYKAAGGLITWPGQRKSSLWTLRGRCGVEGCNQDIGDSYLCRHMHLCDEHQSVTGVRLGRKKLSRSAKARCRWCNQRFEYTLFAGYGRRKFCCQKHAAQWQCQQRVKRPTDITAPVLYGLYWTQGLSLHRIARLVKVSYRTVNQWLVKDGTPRRPVKHVGATRCAVDGCDDALHKIFHRGAKSWYGRLCASHWITHRRRVHYDWYSRRKDERGNSLMKSVRQLVAGLPDSVKLDAEQEIVVAALSGELTQPLTRESVKPYIAAAFRENADAWKYLSLAAPTSTDEGAQTWGDRLGLS